MKKSLCPYLAAGALSAISVMASTSAQTSSARPFCSYSIEEGWSGTPRADYVSHKARPNDPSGLPEALEAINDAFAISVDFDIYILKEENNAFATVSGGRKVVAADVDFLEHLNDYAGTDWAAIQVLAHEVGHHIAGFSNNRRDGELNADYWSGQALYRLGSSRESAVAAIMAVGTEKDTSSHPNKYSRAKMISRGWKDAKAGRVDYSFCEDCR